MRKIYCYEDFANNCSLESELNFWGGVSEVDPITLKFILLHLRGLSQEYTSYPIAITEEICNISQCLLVYSSKLCQPHTSYVFKRVHLWYQNVLKGNWVRKAGYGELNDPKFWF